MMLLFCIFILLYSLTQYIQGRKERGAFVFFFFLTGGFHFLSERWCPVKYTDFAVVYIVAVAMLNAVKGNNKFFKPQIKIYKVVTVIGLYITLEFLRTLFLKEEFFSFALANYRTYIPIFSFWLVQELKEKEVKSLFKQITFITVLSVVLFDLQPLLNIQIFQHASINASEYAGNQVRYRNIPYLAYFFMLLVTIRLDLKRWKTVALVLIFLIAIALTQHRAVMIAYLICVGLYLFMLRKEGSKLIQYVMLGLVVFLFAGEAIINRFENETMNRSTRDDIKTVINMDYKSAVNNEFEDEYGTLSFRVLLFVERVDYMLNHPRYTVFGIGTRHEDSPRTQHEFDFVLGSYRQSKDAKGQTSSGDLAWVNPLMRFGLLGIALLLYLSWLIIRFLYSECRKSDIAMSSFLFYLFLILTSFKNDHLYGNMQLFFIFLLIEHVRYSNVKYKKYQEYENLTFNILEGD